MKRMLEIGFAIVAVSVLVPTASLATESPPLPVGTFYTSSRTDPGYVERVAKDLKQHGFNAIVGNEAFTRKTIDIFQQQGIAVITHDDKFLDHPGVFGSLVGNGHLPGKGKAGDALKAQYQELSKKTGKPLIACLPGEELGLFRVSDPRNIWKEIIPKVRCFRWYGISRHHYGVLYKQSTKGYLAMSSVLSIAQKGDTPYWIVLPGFGKNNHEAEYQNPTPAQIKCMMHMALAYRARGIFLWGLQNNNGWQCLVDDKTLKPADGKYAAAAEMAELISSHVGLLLSLKHAGLDIRCPNPVIDAVPLAAGGKLYIYAINKDTRSFTKAKLLLWAKRWRWSRAREVFAGKDLKVEAADHEGCLSACVSLEPGEGTLLVTDISSHSSHRNK